jgi:hypothetical protein
MVVGQGFGVSSAHIIDCIHKIPQIDDSRLAEIFAREVLAMLVGRELLSPEWGERILAWRLSLSGLLRTNSSASLPRAGPR